MTNTQSRRLAATALLLLAACVTDDPERRPSMRFRGEVASMFVHRGMVQNERGVAQGTMTNTVPVQTGGAIEATAFANVDLSDSVGDAWFDDGHGGRVSQFDLVGAYTHAFEGFGVAAGAHNYNFPFGESFPGGPRTSTTELFARVGAPLLGAEPFFEVRHDVDQANGTYLRFGITEDFPLAEAWTLVVNGHVGWSSESQSLWNYGVRASGLADAQMGATVQYAANETTMIGVTVQGSTIVDDDIADWFDVLGIDSNNVWAGAFVQWSY